MSVLDRTGCARVALPLLFGVASAGAPLAARAQQEAPQSAYLRAAAEHFRVPADEVRILSRWGLPVDEIPAILFVARRSGVSPDAIVSLRRDGTPWNEIGSRYGISAETFHVPLEGAAPTRSLQRAYGAFDSTPRSGWEAIRLTDAEVVALVNLRFLSEQLGVPPAAVLEAARVEPGFPGVYRRLAPRGGR